jgi:hypothetical protein
VDIAELAAGSRYVWWTMEKFPDPSKTTRWRGAGLTEVQVTELGPFGLRDALNAGSIVEVRV